MRVGGMMLAAALALAAAAPALAQDGKAVERGKTLFTEQKCTLCHSVAGKGNAKGPLDSVGAKLTADQMRQWLTDPKTMTEKAKATRKPPMKSYASLPKADVDALAAYLQTLKGK
jgi:mono/diheme cytochrome c family protein